MSGVDVHGRRLLDLGPQMSGVELRVVMVMVMVVSLLMLVLLLLGQKNWAFAVAVAVAVSCVSSLGWLFSCLC